MNPERYLNVHEELLKRCLKGDRKAQFEIYRLYFKAMYNTSLRITGNRTEAEDIMQEAFLKAFQNLDKYSMEVSFGAWLKKIVVNLSIDYLRRTRYESISMTEEMKDEWAGNEAEDADFTGQQVSRVLEKIRELPEGYRIVLSLYLLEGYDHDEIAGILNIAPSTSRSQYLRAKKRLLQNLNKESNETT